jgi:hypothetical protein
MYLFFKKTAHKFIAFFNKKINNNLIINKLIKQNPFVDEKQTLIDENLLWIEFQFFLNNFLTL